MPASLPRSSSIEQSTWQDRLPERLEHASAETNHWTQSKLITRSLPYEHSAYSAPCILLWDDVQVSSFEGTQQSNHLVPCSFVQECVILSFLSFKFNVFTLWFARSNEGKSVNWLCWKVLQSSLKHQSGWGDILQEAFCYSLLSAFPVRTAWMSSILNCRDHL